MASLPSSSSPSTGKLKSPDTPLFRSLLKTKWKQTKSPTSDVKTHSHLSTKQVMLLDWWLTKVKVQVPNPLFKLGVAGKASDGRKVAYFTSSEIVKRHIGGTLETADGITITLAGPINRSRTHENVFPSQVCSYFANGFPFDWEHIGAQYFGGESIDRGRLSEVTSMSNNDANRSPALASKDLPVTRYFDHMMLSSGDYNECTQLKTLFDDILSEYGSFVELNDKDNHQIITDDPLPTEGLASNTSIPRISAKKHRGKINKTDASNAIQSFTQNADSIDIGKNLSSPRVKNSSKRKFQGSDGTTKEVPASKFSISNQEHKFSPATLNPGLTVSIPASKVAKNQSRVNITDTISPVTGKLSQMDTEIGTRHKYTSSKTGTPNCSRGVLTRSTARLVRQRTDPDHIVVEPQVPTNQPFANKVVQTEKISDMIPTSEEAKKSGKDAPSRRVTRQLSRKRS